MRIPHAELLTTVGLRILGGAAGALPPLIALLWLDREAYGHAVADYSVALLLSGPIAQFISQGYLRGLLNAGKRDDKGVPPGTSMVHAYLLLCVIGIGLAAAASLITWVDFAFISMMLAITALSRMQEGYLVATGHKDSAVLLFYVLPPLIACVLMLGGHLAGVDDFSGVALSLVAAYGGCLVASLLVSHGAGGRAALRVGLPSHNGDWRGDFHAVRHFLVSGALLSTTEHVPVVLLNTLGFGASIPGFELARKIASVPYVLIHALNMHMMPELVRTAGESAWEQFRRVLSRFTLLSGAAGCVYVAVVLLGLIGLRWMFEVNLPVDMAMFTILLAASIVTALGAPAGSALVALNSDSLWALAASASLAVQLGVSLLALGDLGPLAIAASVLAQTIVLRGILAVAAATLLASREKQREPVHVAS